MITIDPNNICYVFDVDGTLTKPREKMNPKFAKEFSLWMDNKQCFIATGSDFIKLKHQIPENILKKFNAAFCCMGNEVRDTSNDSILSKSKFLIPDELNEDLAEILQNSPFPSRTGNHLEFRTGMLNFSIVGRNANKDERKEYNSWDSQSEERKNIASFINKKYPTLEASIGGSISIDIIEHGCDKGQVVHALENNGATKIVFIGDKCFPGGNDYGIVRELEKSSLAYEWYNVSGIEDTLNLIRINKVFQGGK